MVLISALYLSMALKINYKLKVSEISLIQNE
jgi:hypothetical protein